MELPEHARKARRSGRKDNPKLISVADLLRDLGLDGRGPASDKALIHEFDDTLKDFSDKFLAKKNLQRSEVRKWSEQSNRGFFRQLATSFLQEGGRGSYFWPDPPRPANKRGYCFSKDRKKICDLVMILAFRRNYNLVNNGKHRPSPESPVASPPATATDAAQQQITQEQPGSSGAADSRALRLQRDLQDRGLTLEAAIDLDGLLDDDFDLHGDDGLDQGPRNPKYLHDPGFPSPEPSFPPMAPRPATVEEVTDEHYLEPSNRVPRERTHTIAPEETGPVPPPDLYDGPNSPEAEPPTNQGEKRPADAEFEGPARRTKSPRLEQGNAAVTTACPGEHDLPPRSPVGQAANNNTSDGEATLAQLYNYILPDGLSRIDGLPGSTSHQGSPELGEDAHRGTLARRSDPPAKAPLALMSEGPASEPEAEAEASRKQPEMGTMDDGPLDEPPKAQADLEDEPPQDRVSLQPETDNDIQDKSQSQVHSEEPEQPVPVVKRKQKPEAPQVKSRLAHEPARDTVPNSNLTFAFTVYQTEMRPVVWDYSEVDFFDGTLRELVDELPMEGKDTLRGLCISFMGKRPDQYQVFLYNEVKYRNVKDIYLTTIKQEMQEAKLDGSRLDYEFIIRPIRSR